MKSVLSSSRCMKRLSFLGLGLVIILLIRPTHVASKSLNQISSNVLYLNAFRYANNQDYIHAAVYLFAYVQQNPPEYANNINGHKTIVDKQLTYLLSETDYSVNLLKMVKTDLTHCNHFPCNQSSLESINYDVPIESLPPPPDAVIVCTKPQYRGACNILFIGSYKTYQSLGVPNDSIASVQVGSRARITLYRHSFGNPPMITLTQNDSDLSNNLTSDGSRWSKIVSTAKVEQR